MPPSVRAIIVTADLDRLAGFYRSVVAAEQTERYPDDGPAFYFGLRVGDSEIGLTADDHVADAPAGRILLSIEVADVDAALPLVAANGGRVTGGPTDMPWGQRVLHVADPDGNAVNLTQTIVFSSP